MKMAICAGFLVLLLVSPAVFAKDITVGGNNGWTESFDYSSWTSSQTFNVGDNLGEFCFSFNLVRKDFSWLLKSRMKIIINDKSLVMLWIVFWTNIFLVNNFYLLKFYLPMMSFSLLSWFLHSIIWKGFSRWPSKLYMTTSYSSWERGVGLWPSYKRSFFTTTMHNLCLVFFC